MYTLRHLLNLVHQEINPNQLKRFQDESVRFYKHALLKQHVTKLDQNRSI